MLLHIAYLEKENTFYIQNFFFQVWLCEFLLYSDSDKVLQLFTFENNQSYV